jgi:hypothetical protein
MRLRPEGHDRRRARDNPAQRSGRLGGLLSRVRRPAVRDSSRVAGEQLAPGQAANARRRGERSSRAAGWSRRGLAPNGHETPTADPGIVVQAVACTRSVTKDARTSRTSTVAVCVQSALAPPTRAAAPSSACRRRLARGTCRSSCERVVGVMRPSSSRLPASPWRGRA